MKKVKFILVVLAVMSGVMFSTNAEAQGQSLPYNMTIQNITGEGWVDNGSINAFIIGSNSNWQLIYNQHSEVIYEKPFNFNGITDLNITWISTINTSNGAQPPTATFNIYIDNNLVVNVVNVTDINNIFNISIPVLSQTQNSTVRIDIDYTNLVTSFANITTSIGMFKIEDNSLPTSINETNYKSNLDIYSYEKSVFITSDNFANYNLTVYNLSGEIVKSENVDLSTSRTEVKLDDLNTGMYIVSINDGNSVINKKIAIK